MSVDLSQMSLAELKRLAKRVGRAIENHEKKRVKEARQAMEKLAKEYGVSLDAIMDGGPKKRGRPKGSGKGKPSIKGKPKFANPADKSQTWTGKGRQPQWFKDAMAAGTSEKDLAI